MDELVSDLINDTNPNFRLTEENALRALDGPEGTSPEVAGPSGKGADIVFTKNNVVVLRREIKSIGGQSQGAFNREISQAARQVMYDGEIFVQISPGRDGARLIARFRGSRPPAALEKYRKVQIMIVDSAGNLLFNGPLVP